MTQRPKPIQKHDVGWPDGEYAQNEYILIVQDIRMLILLVLDAVFILAPSMLMIK